MKRINKISTVPSIQKTSTDLLATLGKIKWTNRYDCPDGYEYNEDGYVETNENYLQISINMMPYLLTALGEYELLYQNAIAFRALNPNKHMDIIRPALQYKYKASFYKEPNRLVLEKALSDAYDVNDLGSILPKLHRGIFSFHSVWYSKDCSIGGRKKIYVILRDDFIDRVRSFMPINTKFKTACVAEESEESMHVVNVYWRNRGLDRKDRTTMALAEALESMAEEGIESATISEICKVAGLSRNTVGELLKTNE